MELTLGTQGVTFATRARAAAIVETIGSLDRLVIDFSGVKTASPSFLDALLGGLSEKVALAEIENVPPELIDLVDRVVRRRGLAGRFKILAHA